MTNKKILITRPKEQGLIFAQQSCLDMEVFLFEPLMTIKYLDISLSELDSYDGVIVTSAHGMKALPENYPCYNVGDYAPTARELADKIIGGNPNNKLSLLYIRGADIAFDMVEALKNYNIDELITYKAVASCELSNNVINALKNNAIGAITFFSRRTAEIFVKLILQHDLMDYIKDIKALCISDSVVECLHSIFGENIEVSDDPDALGMLRMVNSRKRY